MDKCTTGYLSHSISRRFLNQMHLYSSVSGTEGVAVSVEAYDESERRRLHSDSKSLGAIEAADSSKLFWVDTAVANSLPQYALEHFARVVKLLNMDIIRTHLDNVTDGEGRSVTMLRMLVDVEDNDPTDAFWNRVERNLKRQKWVDPKVS